MKSHRPDLLYLCCSLLVMSIILKGCEKGVFFRSEPVVAHTLILNPFEEIAVNDIFEIELRNDTLFSLQFIGKESILENISADIADNSLHLSDNNSLKWLPDYPIVKLIISFPDISTININSVSEIFSDDTLSVSELSLLCNAQLINLDITVNASNIHLRTGSDNYGQYTLKGYSENSELWVFGSARLWADELHTETSQVRSYSIGDCYVRTDKQLRVQLRHYGNIYYYGSPEVIIERMNSRGRLIRIDQ